MNLNRQHVVAPKEALVSLTGLFFIEQHGLLSRDLLDDARASLPALFLRTSGEETMLRRLIEMLKTTRHVHRSFASIANVLEGVATSARTLDVKIAGLRDVLARYRVSAEENADFVGPFLSFSVALQGHVEALARSMRRYLELKETEAKCVGVYRAAKEARDRLKQRLASSLATEASGAVEERIKREMMSSFDYSEAESSLRHARREARGAEGEIQAQLGEIHAMCQMAMNPAMREQPENPALAAAAPFPDVYALFSTALRKHPRLQSLKDAVVELFRLYQHSHGVFRLDFDNLTRAIGAVLENPDTYFETKEEDRDLRQQHDRLRKIEGLIAFLERTGELLADEELEPYGRFSRQLSRLLEDARTPWTHIGEDLLRAKIEAEAELSTRM